MNTAPGLAFGAVMHERFAPVTNRFSYAMFTVCLPLSRLEDVASPLLGIERLRLFSFYRRDHGARDGSPLLPWLRAILQRKGLAEVCDGEVMLQTMPRLFGFVFNPVSFWYCLDREGRVRAVLAEVSNTFGERHNYLIAHEDQREIRAGDELRARKVFHVSPFYPVRGEYRFRFHTAGQHLAVVIDYFDGGLLQLATRVSGRLQPLSAANLFKAWLRCPLLTLGVVARINLQALRLLARRVTFFRKPAAPIEETT
ncbi:DUF1365 domain-containing protein [Uliginosibacterium sp. 31-12]|uniref:DUF1365 domain-containing protein n=1 Tax=Uliginosibacterium sp. 31-12 TaxID=3062781 RepID=UPI0026E46595|nr:DUF1365 domain-containing protein [Uliginosibacterium sp. 31-12]MDO6387447.1 DUF1365 domain-containing protein [Uliginosibacterium sp. 31-12]